MTWLEKGFLISVGGCGVFRLVMGDRGGSGGIWGLEWAEKSLPWLLPDFVAGWTIGWLRTGQGWTRERVRLNLWVVELSSFGGGGF